MRLEQTNKGTPNIFEVADHLLIKWRCTHHSCYYPAFYGVGHTPRWCAFCGREWTTEKSTDSLLVSPPLPPHSIREAAKPEAMLKAWYDQMEPGILGNMRTIPIALLGDKPTLPDVLRLMDAGIAILGDPPVEYTTTTGILIWSCTAKGNFRFWNGWEYVRWEEWEENPPPAAEIEKWLKRAVEA